MTFTYLLSAAVVRPSVQTPSYEDPSSLGAEIPGIGHLPFAKSDANPHETSFLPQVFYTLIRNYHIELPINIPMLNEEHV